MAWTEPQEAQHPAETGDSAARAEVVAGVERTRAQRIRDRGDRVSSTFAMVIGGISLVLGGLAYLTLAADPLEVLLFLAERGGSPALFVVGVLITIGASLASLGTLGFVLRDIRLDPRA